MAGRTQQQIPKLRKALLVGRYVLFSIIYKTMSLINKIRNFFRIGKSKNYNTNSTSDSFYYYDSDTTPGLNSHHHGSSESNSENYSDSTSDWGSDNGDSGGDSGGDGGGSGD